MRHWATQDVRELPSRTRTLVVIAALGLIAAITAAAYVIYSKFGPHHDQYDLRIYYNATSFWLSGNRLYDYWQPDPVNGTLGYTYPPAAAVLMAPMHVFGLGAVVRINFLAIIAAGAGCMFLWLSQRLTLGRLQMFTVVAVSTAIAFCLQPFAQTVAFGQINLFLALLVSIDLLVLARRGSRWTGVLVGLSIAVKLTPGIFLLYFLLRKDWRAVAVSLASCAALTLVSAVVAPAESIFYFTKLLWQSDRVGLLDNTTNQSINGLVARLSSDGMPDTLVWLVLSLILLAVAAPRIRRAIAFGNTLTAVVLTGLLGLLVSPVTWIHHAIWFVPATYLMADHLWRERPRIAAGESSARFPDSTAARAWLATLFLTMAGLWIFFKDTRVFFGLPDTGYAGLGPIAQIEGSLQLLWMAATLLLLPIRTPCATGPDLPATTGMIGARRSVGRP